MSKFDISKERLDRIIRTFLTDIECYIVDIKLVIDELRQEKEKL